MSIEVIHCATATTVVPFRPGTHRAPTKSNAHISAKVIRLLDEAGEALYRDREAARLSLQQASALLSAANPAPSGPAHGGGLAPWQVTRIRAYIAHNLTSPLKVADLAAQVRLSASYFSRAFRQSFGGSPYMHVLAARLDRAKELMRSTDEPLSQIALECGFCDQAHFSRVFHRFTGSTPNNWRRMNAERTK